ncbi:MAG: sigma-70 family RNA polymerase sigma factor [Pyrinomonadaceae bacterium]|nr:sigma-70 family RNA polymerase sigma factor [Phycisphaerales bacterium]
MTPTPDADALLLKAKSGDQDSLIKLLELLTPDLRRRIAPKMQGPWRTILDEDDVLQVTFMEACTRLDKFTGGGASGFLAWLTKLADNNRIDAIRALEGAKRPGPSKRVGTPAGEDSTMALVELLGVTSTTPSRQAAKGEVGRYLDLALATLPAEYEKVIRLYDLEGKEIAEVAEKLGRSEGAVYMLRARAHERLRDAMGPGSKFFSSPS